MKKTAIFLFAVCIMSCSVLKQKKQQGVMIETSMGNIKIMLYDKTIQHSKNFVKLVNEGYYNGQLFHRVIKNFMIQSGDDKSINPQPGDTLGTGGKSYRIPAEFFPEYYHKRGVIAAARESDFVNPNKESSGSQFYLVQGKVFTKEQLDMMVKMKKHPLFTEEQIKTYTTIGGTPHLDNNYTVFGEVVEGLDVVEAISLVPTDKMDRPIEDVRIIKMYTIQ